MPSTPQFQRFSSDAGWERQVALFGVEALSWIEKFHASGCAATSADAYEMVLCLRRGERDRARGLADDIWSRIVGLDEVPGSMALIMRRWFFTSAAYLDFLDDAFEDAEAKLSTATQAVGAAISRRRFLAPFAVHCIDFYQQAIRISRQRRRWAEMRRRFDHLKAVYAGDAPLCRLETGEPFGFQALAATYDANAKASSDDSDQPFLEFLRSRSFRLNSFAKMAGQLSVDPRLVLSHG